MIKKFVQSMHHALRGIRFILDEANFRIQLFVGVLVIVLMGALKVSRFEQLILLMLIFAALSLEILNTIVEKMVDMMSVRYDVHAKMLKDMTAGLVLCGCVAAGIIGSYIFWPYFYGS